MMDEDILPTENNLSDEEETEEKPQQDLSLDLFD